MLQNTSLYDPNQVYGRKIFLESETGWMINLVDIWRVNDKDRILLMSTTKNIFYSLNTLCLQKIPHIGSTESLNVCGYQDQHKQI